MPKNSRLYNYTVTYKERQNSNQLIRLYPKRRPVSLLFFPVVPSALRAPSFLWISGILFGNIFALSKSWVISNLHNQLLPPPPSQTSRAPLNTPSLPPPLTLKNTALNFPPGEKNHHQPFTRNWETFKLDLIWFLKKIVGFASGHIKCTGRFCRYCYSQVETVVFQTNVQRAANFDNWLTCGKCRGCFVSSIKKKVFCWFENKLKRHGSCEWRRFEYAKEWGKTLVIDMHIIKKNMNDANTILGSGEINSVNSW